MVEAIIISLIQDIKADFLWKVSLKILNAGIILKIFTHEKKQTNAADIFSWQLLYFVVYTILPKTQTLSFQLSRWGKSLAPMYFVHQF